MHKLAHFIMHSKAAAYIAALLCVGIWVLYHIKQGENIDVASGVGLLSCVIAGYLSVKAGREFSFVEIRNAFSATIFFLGCAIAPQVIPKGVEGAHLILFSVACYLLLHTYRDRSAMGRYFLAFSLIGVECLLYPPLLLVLPWIVLCGAFMESLHVRTLFAALWGLLAPYWVIGSVMFITGRTALVTAYFDQLFPAMFVVDPLRDAPQLCAQLVWTLLLALPSSIAISFDRTMKLQISAGIRLLIVALAIQLVGIALYPVFYQTLSPCVLLYVSLIVPTFFVRNGTRAKNIYLVMLLTLWALILGSIYASVY